MTQQVWRFTVDALRTDHTCDHYTYDIPAETDTAAWEMLNRLSEAELAQYLVPPSPTSPVDPKVVQEYIDRVVARIKEFTPK